MTSAATKAATGGGCLLAALVVFVAAVVAAITSVLGLATGGLSFLLAGAATPSSVAEIPSAMLTLYQRAAATCPGLPWSVLAGIGKVESDHGRAKDQVSSAGAVGPLQFLPATFAQYAQPVPPGGSRPPTPWDPVDATHAAARLLCANGARDGKDIPAAVFAYNHDKTYLAQVLSWARQYAQAPPADTGKAAAALTYARTQLGVPYVWGGTTPGHAWDCSGLTQASYAAAGITLPRTAQEQYDHGPHVPAGAQLLPGDLLFYGHDPSHVDHVGLYDGNGTILNAPHPGTVVRYEPAATVGTYQGATRPAAGH